MHRTSDAAASLVAIVAVLLSLSSGAELGHLTGSAIAALTGLVLALTSVGQPRRWQDRAAVALTLGFAAGAAVWWPIDFALIDNAYAAGDRGALAGACVAGLAAAAIFIGLDVRSPAAAQPVDDSPSRSSNAIPQPVYELRDAPGAAGADEVDPMETDDTVVIPVAVALENLQAPARRVLALEHEVDEDGPVLPRRAS